MVARIQTSRLYVTLGIDHKEPFSPLMVGSSSTGSDEGWLPGDENQIQKACHRAATAFGYTPGFIRKYNIPKG